MPAKKKDEADVGLVLSVPLVDLEPCSMNPRANLGDLKGLADSIRERGILEPLIVRPGKNKKYEVVAGHRRLAAAVLIGEGILVPVIVMQLSDAEVMAAILVENTQREDLHPLEEALLYVDFAKTMSLDGVAKAVGKTYNYVWDRVQLTKLVPAARKFFLKNEFSIGHAVLISRLTPERQAEVIVKEQAFGGRGGPLFQPDAQPGLNWSQKQEAEVEAWKTRSVAELKDWIDNHIRFDPTEKTVEHLFPEAAQQVKAAEVAEMKIVAITHGFVHPDACDEKERTFGPASWKRADGKEGSKTCEHQVMGVIKAGDGRGQTFLVCVDKKKCKVHWSKEISRSKKEGKKSTSEKRGEAAEARAAEQQRKETEKWERVRARQTLWQSKRGEIKAALIARFVEQRCLPRDMAKQIVYAELQVTKKEIEILSGITTTDVMTQLGMLFVLRGVDTYNASQTFPAVAKKLGVDVEKILTPTKEAKPAKPAKKKGAKA